MQIEDKFAINRKKEAPKSVAAQWREQLAPSTKTSVTTKKESASVSSQWRDYLTQPKKTPSIMPRIENPIQPERKSFIVAPRVTDIGVQERMKQDKAAADKRLRELEAQQRTTNSSNPLVYKAISDEKKQILNTQHNVETTRKKLFVEQAREMIGQNPQDENAWLQYAANTLDPQSLQKYQTDPAFKQATQASLLGEIQYEQRVAQSKAEIDKRWPVDSPIKTIASSLSDWWLGTKAAGNTLNAMGGGNSYNARKIEMGRTVSDADLRAGQAKADAQKQKGAQQYEQVGINRTALVGEDAVKGFLYDFTSFVPDMAVTIALAVATGSTGNVAQMGMKEIGEAFLKKETRKAAITALGKKMLVSPETIPLGAKIFAQSYQGNRAEGMNEGKAFFVAFINAYGQSVLEGGGVNKAIKEGGLDKAIDFLKASLGEGFEEIQQNWWEGAVNKLVGGKDIPWYSGDPNVESVINPQRDLYSGALGFAGGAAGAGFKAPGIAMRYVEEKTSPKMTLDPAAKINRYKDDTVKYEEDKAKYEAAIKNKEQAQKAYEKRIKQFDESKDADYRNEYYTQTELMDAAESIADELVSFEKQSLEAEMLAKVGKMDEWQIFQDQIDSTDKGTIIDAITGGYASDHLMSRVMQEAWKAKPVNGTLKDVKIEPPTPPEDVTTEAPKEPDAPDMSFTVDTSKMAPSILKRMEADLTSAEEAGTAQQIIDMATEGKTRGEITKALSVAPRTVRSVMALKGIPDAKSAAFAKWQQAKTYGNILNEEIIDTRDINHALTSEGLIRDEDAQARVEQVASLNGAKAVPTEDLEIGHLHAQRLGKRLGVDIVFYNGGREGVRGMFSSASKDTLFINASEANEGKITMDIIGHEFLHALSTNHKDLYATLRGVVGDSLTPEKIKTQLAKYKNDPEYQKRLADDQELLIEEMLAEESGSLFTDKQFWQNVYDKDATVAQKLVRLMRSLINRVLGGDKKNSGNLGVMTEMQLKQFQTQLEDAVAEVMGRGEVENSASSDTVNLRDALPLFTNDNLSGMLKENLGLSDEEANLGAQALKALEEKYSVRNTAGREVDGSRRIRTIARDYTKKFLNEGKVEFIGKKISGPEELAVIAQVLRDPRFETFRLFFTNESGEIVHHAGVSSRMPGSSAIFVGKTEQQKQTWIHVEMSTAKGRGATGFYLMHNHPSGQPTPSDQDINVTGIFANNFGPMLNFNGHIIINSNQYSTILPKDLKSGTHTIHDLNLGPDKLLKPEKPHALLGRAIRQATDVVDMARELKATKGYSTLFYLSPGLKVRGIQEIPSEIAANQTKMRKHLKKNAIDFGGHRPFLVAENSLVFDLARHLIDDQYLFEVINFEDGMGAHGRTNSPKLGVWQGRTEGVGERAWEEQTKYSTRMAEIETAFKDSKIRNYDGSLKMVFHGTGSEFTVFDHAKGGSHTGADSAKMGFFFSDNRRMADSYRQGEYDFDAVKSYLNGLSEEDLEIIADKFGFADYDWDTNEFDRKSSIGMIMDQIQFVDKTEGIDSFKDFVKTMESSGLYNLDGQGWKKVEAAWKKSYGHIMPLYLNITNPRIVEHQESFEDDFFTLNIAKAKSQGHDGVIFKDVSDAITAFDEKDPPTGDVYIAFNSEQIKSPKGNLPVNLENPDIRFSVKQPTIDISMDVKDAPPDIKGGFGRAYQRMVDRNLPLSRLDETVKMRVSNTALVSGTVERIFHHALVDMNGNEVFQSLQEALKDFADNKDFWIYKAQQHNIDRAGEGKPVDPGMSVEDSEAYVKVAEAAHPEYKAWSETVTSWIDDFMQTWGIASGTVDAEMYENLRAMYKSYFPTQREFTDLEKSGTGSGGRKYVDQANVIKKAKGSDRDITNPVGNIMMMVNKVVRTARYNEVGQAMLDHLRSNPQANYGEEISPNIGMFQSKKLDNIVTVWEGGQPTYIQINDKDLLDALHGLPRIINNAPAVRKFTGLFKGLITQYNPFFALRNIFRDIPTAYVYGSQNNPLFFVANLVKAGYQYATESGGAALYKNLGGAGAGMFSASEAAQYAKLLQPSAASKLKLPLRVIEWFNNLTEQSPRISEFNYVLEKTGSVEKALYAANNVTVNFSRGGDISKQMEPFVPYLNASIQGLDKFVQSFRFDKDPKGAALRMVKGGVAVTLPQIASYLICMADDDEAYKALSQRTKDSSYVFPKGDGTYWKIPKSREIGVLFGSLFERALTGNFKGFTGTVTTNFTPVDPFTSNIASAFVYNLPANKDFAGRTIVPQSLQGYSPRNQYDDNTSEIAKTLGNLANLSPKQIDYIIRSYTGVVGQLLLPTTTKRAGAGTAVERITTGAFTADPAFSSQVVSDFYERLDDLEKAKHDYNRDNAVPTKQVTEQERVYSAMNRVSSEVTRATKYINANLKSNDPKIQQIRNAINKQLARALKAESFVDVRTTERDLATELYRLGVR